MPRTARIKDLYGTYHIFQKAGDNNQLFSGDCDRERFLKILGRAQKKYSFILYAYCVLSSNEYHLAINVNGNDLSQIMKSINITYAIYTNCNEKLFKDRYKSRLLCNETEIKEVVSKIHEKYRKYSLWNSFCVHNNYGLKPYDIEIFAKSIHGTVKKNICLHSLSVAERKLQTMAQKRNQTIEKLTKDKNVRNQLLRQFRKTSTLSLKELGKVFGGLSESAVCKILNQDKGDNYNETIE